MIGHTVEGSVGPILPGGEAAVNVNGTTVLVANAVPGDVLAVHVSAKRRGVFRGEIVEVIEPSKTRIEPPCPVGNACGGCALQSISGQAQAELKSGWVKSAFEALVDAGTDWIPVQFHADHCRRRVRWFVGSDRKGLFLGFYAQASHQPVRHCECMVLTPELNALRTLIEEKVILNGIGSVQAVHLSDGIHVILETECKPAAEIVATNLESMPLQWWWRDCNGITRPMQKPVVNFHDLLPAGDRDVALTVGPDGFVQGQIEGNRELIAQIQQWAGKVRRVADLFCGIGNLSLPLAAATGAEVVGAELNAASVKAATANAKVLGITSTFAVANLFELFELEPYIGVDLLILDPPRRGAKRICGQMSRFLPDKIIMISCDVAAGARDGVLLKEHGYHLKALRALDLFPGAGHVEAMSLWQRS